MRVSILLTETKTKQTLQLARAVYTIVLCLLKIDDFRISHHVYHRLSEPFFFFNIGMSPWPNGYRGGLGIAGESFEPQQWLEIKLVRPETI